VFKRLAGFSGSLIETPPAEGDTLERLQRPAILIHEGTFQSQDGEIAFDEARVRRLIERHNAMINELADQYGGIDKMPIGAFPPFIDQHAEDSTHRIMGRLASLLRFERRDIPKAGKNIACAVADVVILGKDNVQKAKDGRIYHLSIGIDEDTETLGEVSAVIDPAAPGAMLLAKSRRAVQPEPKGGTKMPKKNLEAMARHRAKLSSVREALNGIKSTIAESGNRVRLEKKKADLNGQFKRLMAGGRMTPAEYKKMDLTKLAALGDDALKTVMDSFEVREPVIMPGQRGSTQATEVTEMGKKLEADQRKRLKAEVVGDIKRLTGKKVRLGEGTSDTEESENQDTDSGKVKHLADGVVITDTPPPAAPTDTDTPAPGALEAMQAQVDELNTQVGRLSGMIEEIMKGMEEETEETEETEEAQT
jgi:hypothetical protein